MPRHKIIITLIIHQAILGMEDKHGSFTSSIIQHSKTSSFARNLSFIFKKYAE